LQKVQLTAYYLAEVAGNHKNKEENPVFMKIYLAPGNEYY
jgi:hypothetical protein